MDLTFTKIVLF